MLPTVEHGPPLVGALVGHDGMAGGEKYRVSFTTASSGPAHAPSQPQVLVVSSGETALTYSGAVTVTVKGVPKLPWFTVY
jgi:hypothetical protein